MRFLRLHGVSRRDLRLVGGGLLTSLGLLILTGVVISTLLGGGRLSSEQIAAQVGPPGQMAESLGSDGVGATVKTGFELESNIIPTSVAPDDCLGIYFPTYRPVARIGLAVTPAPGTGRLSGAATAWTYASSRNASAEFRDLERAFDACSSVLGRVLGGQNVMRHYSAESMTTPGGVAAVEVEQQTVRSSTSTSSTPSASTVHYYLLDATVFAATCQPSADASFCAPYFADFEARLDALAHTLH